MFRITKTKQDANYSFTLGESLESEKWVYKIHVRHIDKPNLEFIVSFGNIQAEVNFWPQNLKAWLEEESKYKKDGFNLMRIILNVAKSFFESKFGKGTAPDFSFVGSAEITRPGTKRKTVERKILNTENIKCEACSNKAKHVCSGCHLKKYCSEKCQKNHWQKEHSEECV